MKTMEIAVVAKTILMNMSVSQVDLVSLVSRISLLEERQNLLAKYTVNVKRQLERLIERFNTRAELPMLENLQEAIAQLCEKLTSWQQQQNQFVNWSETLDNFEPYESFNGTEAFEMPVQEQEWVHRWVKLEEAEFDADEQTDHWSEVNQQSTIAPNGQHKAIATDDFLRQYNDQRRT
jgi:hypothetical protein